MLKKKMGIIIISGFIMLIFSIPAFAAVSLTQSDNFEAVTTPPNNNGLYTNDFLVNYAKADLPWGKTLSISETEGYNNSKGLVVTNAGISNTSTSKRRGAWLATKELTIPNPNYTDPASQTKYIFDRTKDIMFSYKIKIVKMPSDATVNLFGWSYTQSPHIVAYMNSTSISTVDDTVQYQYEKDKWYTFIIRIDCNYSATTTWYDYVDFVVLDDQGNVVLSALKVPAFKMRADAYQTYGLHILPFHIPHYGTITSEDYKLIIDDMQYTEYTLASGPDLVYSSVANGANNIALDANKIDLVFDQAVNDTTTNSITLYKTGNPLDKVSVNIIKTAFNRYTVSWTDVLSSYQDYTLNFSNVKNTSGIVLNNAKPTSLSFKTKLSGFAVANNPLTINSGVVASGSYTFDVLSGEAQRNSVAVLALYSGTGAKSLSTALVNDVVLNANGTTQVTFDLEQDYTNISEVKLFLFDGITSLKPLMDAYEIR